MAVTNDVAYHGMTVILHFVALEYLDYLYTVDKTVNTIVRIVRLRTLATLLGTTPVPTLALRVPQCAHLGRSNVGRLERKPDG